MAIRIRYSVKVQISSDPATEGKDLGNLSYEVACDSFGEGGVRKFLLPAGTVNLELPLGNVSSASFLMIRTAAHDPTLEPVAISVKPNLIGAEPITIQPLETAAEGHLVLSSSTVSALFATNAGAVDMDIILAIAGD